MIRVRSTVDDHNGEDTVTIEIPAYLAGTLRDAVYDRRKAVGEDGDDERAYQGLRELERRLDGIVF